MPDVSLLLQLIFHSPLANYVVLSCCWRSLCCPFIFKISGQRFWYPQHDTVYFLRNSQINNCLAVIVCFFEVDGRVWFVQAGFLEGISNTIPGDSYWWQPLTPASGKTILWNCIYLCTHGSTIWQCQVLFDFFIFPEPIICMWCVVQLLIFVGIWGISWKLCLMYGCSGCGELVLVLTFPYWPAISLN